MAEERQDEDFIAQAAERSRQTLLGEDKEVKKEKGFKGLPLRI